MNLHIPPSSRISSIVLTLGIAGLLAIFASVIFVGAYNEDNNLSPAPATTPVVPTKARIAENFGRLPLSFELNQGQIDQRVKFLSHGPGYDLFLTSTEAVLRVQKPHAPQADRLKQADENVREGTVLRLKMLGANATPQVEGQEELPGKIHYLLGNDPARWRRNIPTYKRAYFKDVYPGIDVVYYGNQRELEYDFVVGPGANPKLIRFVVEGADKIRLDKSGRLALSLRHGEVSLNKPVIYQNDANGFRREVKGGYVINGNEVRFKLERFDTSKPLVIDPVLSYSTLLGAGNSDSANGIAVDSQGSAYVTGTTDSSNFPTTPGAFKTTNNSFSTAAFVTKLDPTGSSLVYSTYLAGANSGATNGFDIAVDSSGNAHITGSTSTNDFPIVNGLKTTSTFFRSTDAAVTWTNQNSGLVGEVIALAAGPNVANTVYAATTNGFFRSTDAGVTWTKPASTGFPSSAPINTLAVDPTNSNIVYAGTSSIGLVKTTNGGDSWSTLNTSPISINTVNCIVFDPATPATMYVGSNNGGVFKSTDSGATWITQNNFGVAGTPTVRTLAIDPSTPLTIYAGTFGNGVFKSTNGGSVWTAMNNGMGGPNPLNVNVIVIDPTNPATLYTGHLPAGGINISTNGAASWTPVTNGVPQQFGPINAMAATTSGIYAAPGGQGHGILKTTNGGTTFTPANTGLWNTFVRTIVPHPTNGSILYVGTDTSFNVDSFATKLNASGSGILFSTLLGGNSEDVGNGIAVDGNGNIFVAGQTTSLNFPVVNAAQGAPTATSCNDAFVTKMNPSVPSYVFSTYLRGTSCDTANAVAVDTSGNAYVTGVTSSNNFPTANAFQPALAAFSEAFVTKLTSDGAFIYSTYLGGNSAEDSFAIAVDASGNAYVTGSTQSSNFPTVNPIQATNGGGILGDVFVTKFNSSGSALIYSTFLGGAGSDTARGIALDSANNAYVTGTTDSGDFPLTAGAFRTRSPMFKSTDGAANWSNDNIGFTSVTCCSSTTVTVTALVVHPTETSTVYAGTPNGVFKSTNGGGTWSPMNNGLVSRSVVALVIDPVTPSTLYLVIGGSGANRGVYKSIDGGGTWIRRVNGLGSLDLTSLVIDPVTPNVLYAGLSCCFDGSHIYKTTDGADNWSPVVSAPPQSPTSLAIDPLNHSIIYVTDSASPGTTFKSGDAGTTWQALSVFAQSISVSPLTPALLYASSVVTLSRSTDGGFSWSPVPVPARPAKIVFDPVNASTLYLLANPFFVNAEGVFKSTDNGQTWKPMNKGLNTPRAFALAVDPVRPSMVYLASSNASGSDGFVTKINAAGNGLIYSTLIGGSVPPHTFSNTEASGIAVDSSANAYITGFTPSQNFPVTTGSYQPFNRGFADAFIAKLSTSYVISGRVLNNGVTPLGGAEVVLNDGGSLTSVFTESDGSYQFTRLREGGNYTVSASKPHFTMTPPSQTFNNLNSDQVLDFSALQSDSEFFTISGKISENGVGLVGVKVTLSGSQPGLRVTDSNGNYSFELIGGGNYTVTPSQLGFNFGAAQTFNNLSANQAADFAATRQSFVVTNANNHGSGSLRDAIINANATIGTDTITFDIPGPGVKVISLLNLLPEITDRVVIDATTQPGYAGTPLIELDGVALVSGGPNGLTIKAGGSTVRGLAIGNFRSGFGISLNSCDNNVIQGNYLGVAADGTSARPNGNGITLATSSNNLIGGTTAATRNVISGNDFEGLRIVGNANVIQGNFIGTNAAGTAELRNSFGVTMSDSTSVDNLIGGTAAGAGNLISGNQSTGILVNGTGTTIQGNLIGTDITGTKKIPNFGGVQAVGQNMLVGGITAGARNVISGNSSVGVHIRGTGSRVQGNYIGTDITGTLALGNTGTGVVAGENALVGGTVPEARNVIAANGTFGNVALGVNNSGSAATVQGNYIGTDVTGTKALGGSTAGINILSSNNIIGGLLPGAGNIISGNSSGIQLGSSFPSPVGNVIQGNFIGLNAAGNGSLPNTQQGIAINNDAVNNIIGGTESGATNKIAFNGGPGITVNGNAQGNSIRGNAIFSNNGLGIDLGSDGVTANDGSDPDTGPNNLQNFPVITSVISASNSTTIQGSLKSLPNTAFQLDFYSNAAIDPSGNGEGALFFNTTTVNTNNNGDATINVTFPAALAAGRIITATATDPNGNTSEFSAADASGAAGSVQFTASTLSVIEDIGTLSVTVVRTGGTSGNLSVDFSTTNGTAVAGQDYTAAAGTLTFSDGETSKTIQIPITDDATTEPDETFTVTLLNGSNVEALGAPSNLVVTLQDRSTTPIISVSGVSVVEGNTGSTTDAMFTINLSAATSRAVSFNFATVNLGALGGTKCGDLGVDYVTASGSLSFSPTVTAFSIPIKVCGDNNAENNENFRIALSSVSGAAIQVPLGLGLIVDDDLFELLLEEPAPVAGQAAALDALLAVRDPFRVVGIPDWFPTGADKNTRVVFFVRGLQLNPGETAANVGVFFQNNQTGLNAFVSAEAVQPIPNTEFTQVVVRLQDTLTPGTYIVQIQAHQRITNIGSIRIIQ